jgi:hypothetical protein
MYPNPLGHTLKSSTTVEYVVLDQREKRLQKWFGEVSKWFQYIIVGFKMVQKPTIDIWEVSK